jgi:hypothetical protein
MADCRIVREQMCQWTVQTYSNCIQTQTDKIATCTATQNQGYNQCTQTATQGYSQCSGWGKWFCIAWTWLTYVVCVASVWIDHFVCIAWAWITVVACVAWALFSRVVCVAVSWIMYVICAAPLFLTNLSLTIGNFVHVFLQCLRPRDTPRNPLEKPGWLLTFEDDFGAGAVDLGRWQDVSWWGEAFYGGKDLPNGVIPTEYFQPLSHVPPYFQFGPSVLRMRNDSESVIVNDSRFPGGTFTVLYSGAWLEWLDNRAQLHGYFEIRCRIPDVSEHYPAFWLAGPASWPPEIDVFEFNRNHTGKYASNIHWSKENKDAPANHRACQAGKYFHIYACEWTGTEVRWYYDNALIRVETVALADFTYPMIVIVDTSPDNRPGHHPENSTYPNYFEVDYVRAYKR